ncbi:nitroreductase [Actinoplanes tereljensis]|uniref:NAD(P)H nitroreductase n=1 Tax=Paractinoplanes tereljensis TaxID=571912 RepID=A0A919TS92_9ACTN|nr:nitroreductase [Actinoplanes tereljensis]GIF18832.1 NAD(P)H nitroreductase [Actinoplanes tereljensis]
MDDAVSAAGHAPSVLNTQPWHWRSHDDTLDLSVDPARLLAVTDPDSRLAVVSCGAALHHALISLAAGGWQATVTRSATAGHAGHLATVRVDGRIPIEPESVAHLRTIGLRYTDRRPIQGDHIDADKLRSIAAAAESQGASLHLLRPHQAFELAAATDFAVRTESGQAGWQAELQQWAGGARPRKTGLPDTAIPQGTTPTTVISRDFGHRSDMVIAEAHDRTAIFAILYGPEDRPLNWLRAGEALSAAWLTATELDVSVLPLSVTIEVPDTRETVRQLLGDAGHPFLVLRFGVLDPAGAGAPHTPRLPTDQTVERTTD